MRIYLSLLLLSLMNLSYAQEEIFLENPSFEGLPRLSQTPKGWYDCGFPGESTVDLHPVPESQFRVDKMAIDGETYVGMITRENETWEAISQRLSQPLAGGKTYNFSIYLAQAAAYLSSLQNSPKDKINFNTPIKLRIWGGNGYCKKDELLAESLSVTNKEWLKFDFALRPDSDLRYIILEAFYQTSAPASYNGNILLDNASSILEVENAELSREDSLTTVRLKASARTPVFTADSSSKDKNVSENLATEDSAKAKSTVIKPSQKKLKEGVLKEEDRNFIKE